MTTNYLREYGTQLINNGYKIVPISRGAKAPLGVKGWQKLDADLNLLGQWIMQGFEGVGVLCNNTPAVDIDVLDTIVSGQMVSWVRRHYPGGLLRVGRAPKTLLAYRTDRPFKKIRSATYEDRFGDQHAVEILGDGQQYVAYAEHPDTLRPYEWREVNDGNQTTKGGPGIADVRMADLPILTGADARAIVSHFETIADSKCESGDSPDGWKKIREGMGNSTAEVVQDNEGGGNVASLAALRPPLDLSTAQIRRDLASVQPMADNYDSWLHIGMSLWHQYGGSEEGFDLWHTWSVNSTAFDGPDALRARWSGFQPDVGRRPITFASVRRWARDARMEEDPQTAFLERYVYVADGDYVHDLEGSAHDKPFELREFRNFTSNIRAEIEVPDGILSDPDRVKLKILPVHQLWMLEMGRKCANSFAYVPGGNRILKTPDGRQYINRFHMPLFPKTCEAGSNEEKDLLGPFLRHMEFIIPNGRERDWFYDWMAFNIMKPDERCKVTPLLVATDHGTGRGWIVKVMNLLIGSWNCTKTKMSTLNGDSSAGQYQDFMNESLLCCVEEVKDADKPYGVVDSIRDYLTEDTLEINLKYGAKETKKVYTNFLWNSNHADAIVLKAEDRRVNVFKTEGKPKSGDYYERLYQWLECPKTPHVGMDSNDGGSNETSRSMHPFDSGHPALGTTTGAVDSNTEDAQENEFYDRNGVNVGPGLSCLWHWLCRRPLDNFNSFRPIDNKARRDMIENTQTDIESLFLDMVENPPMELMTIHEISTFLEAEKLENGGDDDSGFGVFGGLSDGEKRQIKKLCQHHLGRQEQVKITFKMVDSQDSLKGKLVKRDRVWKVRPWSFCKNRVFSMEEIRKTYENR